MIRKYKKKLIISSLLMLLPVLVGLVLWNQLPDRMATHWGIDGNVDGWASKAFAVFGMPLILIPVPGILLISAFRQLNDKPPRAGGILCLLAMVPVTVWLCSTGPMALYKLYFLLIMLGGYVMFFLLQLIYHADRFKKAK